MPVATESAVEAASKPWLPCHRDKRSTHEHRIWRRRVGRVKSRRGNTSEWAQDQDQRGWSVLLGCFKWVFQSWASECPDVKNYNWWLNLICQNMLYSCTYMATVGINGLRVGREGVLSFILVLHRVPKKTCDYIFYNNFHNRCPITIIFGIVSSKSMRHWKMVSFPTSPIYLTLGNHRTQKNDQFCHKQHIVLRINNDKQYFIYT